MTCVQVVPKLVDMYMPPQTGPPRCGRRWRSCHWRSRSRLPALSPAVQVVPPSTEVWMLPPKASPASHTSPGCVGRQPVPGLRVLARVQFAAGHHVSSHAGRQHGLVRILGNLPVIRARARHADRLARLNLGRGGEGDDHGAGCRRSHRVRGVRQSLLCKPCDRCRCGLGAGAGAGGGRWPVVVRWCRRARCWRRRRGRLDAATPSAAAGGEPKSGHSAPGDVLARATSY